MNKIDLKKVLSAVSKYDIPPPIHPAHHGLKLIPVDSKRRRKIRTTAERTAL